MARKRDLFWRLHLLDRREIASIVIVAILVVAAIGWMMVPYRSLYQFAFGPGWECTSVGQGEPVCIKTGSENSN